MKCTEIIVESEGKKPEHAVHASGGEWKFRDKGGWNPTYNLNRVMMAAAMADGSDKPVKMDKVSWIGVHNWSRPYSEVENKMVQQALKATDSEMHHIDTDHRSREHPSTHSVSPHHRPGPIKLNRK
jgi:hypothetical protein